MKILHIITDLNTGGAEMMLCRLLEDSKAFEHAVVALSGGGALKERAIASAARVHTLEMRRGFPTPGTAARLWRIARRERPNAIQGWMYHGNLAAVLCRLALRFSRPLLWNVRHSLYDLGLEKRLTRAIIRAEVALSRLPAAIVYNSRISAEQHERLGFDQRNSVVIPNGFDCETFRPRPGARARLCEQLGIDAGQTLVGMVARWHPMKDHGNLIRAVARLGDGVPLHLVLAGTGVDQGNGELRQFIRLGGIGDRITLLGERQDVPEIMAGLDLLVVPSAWGEAFPQVIGEAMAAGLPCVATDVGDSRLIVGETGTIVPPRDPDALAQALAQMVQVGADGRRQLGERARARIVEHWGLAEIVRRYERLFERVANGGC